MTTFLEALSDFSNKNPAKLEMLPLIHATSIDNFTSIVASDSLKIQSLEKYGNALLFLFYGRPAYVLSESQISGTKVPDVGPIYFVFNTKSIFSIEGIYPFDTGAFIYNIYEKYIDNKTLAPKDFYLGDSLSVAPQVVSTFFGDNRNYYNGLVKSETDVASVINSYPPAKNYHQLIGSPPMDKPDDRKYTIEVQLNGSIDLTKTGTVDYVILPQSLVNKKDVVDALEKWGAKKMSYSTFDASTPSKYKKKVMGLIRIQYKKQGLMDDDVI